MATLHPPPDPSVRTCLSAEHVELERLLERLIEALEEDDRDAVSSVWSTFRHKLGTHFDVEERYLIPALLPGNPRAAAAILAEHRHLRARVVELGAGVDQHVVRLRTVRAFIDELRAHAAHEERVLYRWADESAPESARIPLLQAVGALLGSDASASPGIAPGK